MKIFTIENFKKTIISPKKAYRHLDRIRSNKKYDKQFVSKFLTGKDELIQYAREIRQSGMAEEIYEKLEKFKKNLKGKNKRGYKYSAGDFPLETGIRYYSIIRKIKPEAAVETGVLNGTSTSFILLALHHNKKGMLYSIDYPEVEDAADEEGIFWEGKGGGVIPKGEQSGWIIPQYLRENWELIIGKSQEKLPALLERVKPIDFFMHDSEHSYDCMWFEFEEAYKVLKNGGILASDDIDMNSSFYEFAKKNNKQIIRFGTGKGLFIK